jgi:hypothetical protein
VEVVRNDTRFMTDMVYSSVTRARNVRKKSCEDIVVILWNSMSVMNLLNQRSIELWIFAVSLTFASLLRKNNLTEDAIENAIIDGYHEYDSEYAVCLVWPIKVYGA